METERIEKKIHVRMHPSDTFQSILKFRLV